MNADAPLPLGIGATMNSTLGPQLHNFTLTGFSGQIYTFGTSDTFQGTLRSADRDNILGTSVSLMIGSTVVETAVIGAANDEAFSDKDVINSVGFSLSECVSHLSLSICRPQTVTRVILLVPSSRQ